MSEQSTQQETGQERPPPVGRCEHCRQLVPMSEVNALGYHEGDGINRFTGEDEGPWCGPVAPTPEKEPSDGR